jgi:hypothetical protein
LSFNVDTVHFTLGVNIPEIMTILAKLAQLERNDAGVYFSTPCSEAEIALTREQSQVLLGHNLPEGYIELLRMSNGVQINNAVIESASAVIELNTELRATNQEYVGYLVLGYQGNMEHYVFNHARKTFQTVNFFSVGEVFETYVSFNELLSGIINAQVC